MKVKRHWALLFALALPSLVAENAEDDAKNAARVGKWAKGILADFWDLARSCMTGDKSRDS